MSFTLNTKVRFADVDPAGIVFYPRYFEMLNAAVEDWFAQDLGADFSAMHQTRHIGVPTVKLTCEFVRPSRLNDLIDITITVTHLGRSSVGIAYVIAGDGEVRVKASAVLVCMDLIAQKAVAWPDDIRENLARALPAA